MTGAFEGDLIRPLGLVTLNFAYAEGEIDELLSVLPAQEPYDDAKRQWPVGRKLGYAQELVQQLNANSLSGLSATLKEAKPLFERRNTLIHSQIFSGGHVVSNRKGAEPQQVSPEELVQLAEQIFSWKEHLNMHRWRHLMPLLAAPDDA